MQTLTVGTYTGHELKELSPELYAKKLNEWQNEGGDTHHDWWDSTYEDVKSNFPYYFPQVQEFHEQYPQPWQDAEQTQAAYDALLAKCTGVLEFIGGETEPITSFDCYHKEIELAPLYVYTKRVLDLIGPGHANPFVNQGITSCSAGWRRVYKDFEDTNWVYEDDVREFLYGMKGCHPTEEEVEEFYDLCLEAMEIVHERLLQMIEDIKSHILTVLESEYDYLTSEECFLEKEIEVTEDDLENYDEV